MSTTLRTAFSWFGVEFSIVQSVVLAAAIVLAIVVWTVWPPDGGAETELTGSD